MVEARAEDLGSARQGTDSGRPSEGGNPELVLKGEQERGSVSRWCSQEAAGSSAGLEGRLPGGLGRVRRKACQAARGWRVRDLPWGAARCPGCEDAQKRDAAGRQACDTLGLGSVCERC